MHRELEPQPLHYVLVEVVAFIVGDEPLNVLAVGCTQQRWADFVLGLPGLL
jgi:hypothetical protein